jgi:hypothetical protein
LDRVTSNVFSPLVGDGFLVARPAGKPMPLQLIEAIDLPYRNQDGSPPDPSDRPPFSLLFRGVARPRLASRTYRVLHPQLGIFDLFLNPVDRPTDVSLYEAIFA